MMPPYGAREEANKCEGTAGISPKADWAIFCIDGNR